jgi:hypothetical protein
MTYPLRLWKLTNMLLSIPVFGSVIELCFIYNRLSTNTDLYKIDIVQYAIPHTHPQPKGTVVQSESFVC